MSDVAGAVVKAMSRWDRKPADLYPTPTDCVTSLLPHVQALLPVKARVLEPACADGQISKALREAGYQTVDFDIRTDIAWGQGGVDFLDKANFDGEMFDCVWTNPPFNLAEAFIRRSVELADVVIMLLKSNYFHTKGRKRLFEDTQPFAEYKLTWRPAFLESERGRSPLMDCSWFVWKRGHSGPCITVPIDRVAADKNPTRSQEKSPSIVRNDGKSAALTFLLAL